MGVSVGAKGHVALPVAFVLRVRTLFPWLKARGFHQLDDSDSSVWVWDPERTPNSEVARPPPVGR